ncbi:hypothetical protein F0160_17135 [Paraburkholderia sp. JPY303]|uniref:hypothetical protein n=1 Tax=Paraburkholderia atlantica TaxID=2654982 RepID=UPI001591831B|nr:hypothetical protein [Paraburkholderia atlantica]NUY32215.1 hypothetical protein [Paraburkholderia atlantica]
MRADPRPLWANFSDVVKRNEAQPIEARRLKAAVRTAKLRGKNAATKIENNSKIFVRLYVAKEMNLKIDENESLAATRLCRDNPPFLTMWDHAVRIYYGVPDADQITIKVFLEWSKKYPVSI